MRPLIFLFTRSFYNGIKRAISTPKRAIGVIFFSLYYYFLIIRSVVPITPTALPVKTVNRMEMPNLQIVGAVVFGLFVFASIFMMSGILAFRGGFRPPDVDVLFPTPVEPRTVLIFRIVRDYFFTLISPLVFGLIGWRGTSFGLNAFIKNYPVHSFDVFRSLWIAWMLMSLGWISLSYGASLFVGRSDLRSERNQKIVNYSVLTSLLVAAGYIGFRLHLDMSWQTCLSLSHSWLLQIIFLPAEIATDLTIGALQGDRLLVGIALFGQLAIIGLGLALAMTQVSWLYDQAAARGFSSITNRKLRRSGDYYGLAAERAREGKLGKQRLSKRLSKLRAAGPWGLVWKEQLLQLRGPLSGVVLTMVLILGSYAGIAYLIITNADGRGYRALTVWTPPVVAFFLGMMNGFNGFMELRKKVDVLKPLPFSSTKIIFFEVLAKLPIPVLILGAGSLEFFLIRPTDGLGAIAGLLIGISVVLSVISGILLGVVLFPDYEDPTQRSLGGIVMLLAIVICSSPGLATYLLLNQLFQLPDILSAIPTAALLIAISVGAAYLSGLIYADYNPNE